jgi:hypothetical protein
MLRFFPRRRVNVVRMSVLGDGLIIVRYRLRNPGPEPRHVPDTCATLYTRFWSRYHLYHLPRSSSTDFAPRVISVFYTLPNCDCTV